MSSIHPVRDDATNFKKQGETHTHTQTFYCLLYSHTEHTLARCGRGEEKVFLAKLSSSLYLAGKVRP